MWLNIIINYKLWIQITRNLDENKIEKNSCKIKIIIEFYFHYFGINFVNYIKYIEYIEIQFIKQWYYIIWFLRILDILLDSYYIVKYININIIIQH